jgi:hypothetical protein
MSIESEHAIRVKFYVKDLEKNPLDKRTYDEWARDTWKEFDQAFPDLAIRNSQPYHTEKAQRAYNKFLVKRGMQS